MIEVSEHVDVVVPVEIAWAALTDWDRQGEWMLGTEVHAVGERELSAFTGIGRVGFTDTMEITLWQPPTRCEVRHTGGLVNGTGVFEVRGRDGGATVTWSELLEPPLGAVGRIGWRVTGPAFRLGLRYSLRRFARFARCYR